MGASRWAARWCLQKKFLLMHVLAVSSCAEAAGETGLGNGKRNSLELQEGSG